MTSSESSSVPGGESVPTGTAANYGDLKLPALRSLLKERGLVAPFGSTRENIVGILQTHDEWAKTEEAA